MIDADFVQAIADLSAGKTLTVDGKTYASKQVFNAPLPDEPLTAPLSVSTLTGLVDYCSAFKPAAGHVVQVRSYHEVALLSDIQGVKRQRENFVTANCGAPGFKFGQFISHSEFMIAIQALFLDYGDRAKVMKIVGTVREDVAKTSQDDGITQKVTASAGIALAQEVSVPNPVILQPFRTFTEIQQPPSNFVLRVNSKTNGLPEVALFEADGGRWKAEAIQGIREYLASKLQGITIIA